MASRRKPVNETVRQQRLIKLKTDICVRACASVCVCANCNISTFVSEKGASHLPETVRAAQITQVSVGGHPGVELTAQNDGGCREDCGGEKERHSEQEDFPSASFSLGQKGDRLLSDLICFLSKRKHFLQLERTTLFKEQRKHAVDIRQHRRDLTRPQLCHGPCQQLAAHQLPPGRRPIGPNRLQGWTTSWWSHNNPGGKTPLQPRGPHCSPEDGRALQAAQQIRCVAPEIKAHPLGCLGNDGVKRILRRQICFFSLQELFNLRFGLLDSSVQVGGVNQSVGLWARLPSSSKGHFRAPCRLHL